MNTDLKLQNKEEPWIKELRISASLTSILTLVFLFFLLVTQARAEDPPRPPGSRAYSNPFPNQPPAPGGRPYFDDEEEEVDFFDDGPPGGTLSGGYNPDEGNPGGSRPPGGGGRSASTGGAVSAGGNATASGVIPGTKRPNIRVDDETGEGSKEVVTDFNFPDADILEIAKTLSKLTGKNLILDKDVKGRITIVSNSPITVGDAWKAFLTALDMNGFALIPSGKFIRIARNRDARDKQVRTYVGDFSPDTDALITRVFQLKYIGAEEVARVFRSFTPANSRIVPHEQTNTVIVTDTGSNISKLARMLEILDVEGFDAGIEVIPVKFASAVELAKLIDQLIPGTGAGPGTPGGPPRFGAGGAAGRFSARRTKEGGIINTIIADDRSNNMIVHANSKGADQVRELVAKLDQKTPATSGGGKVHVIYLQFAEAEKLANTLNGLTQGGSRPPGGPGGAPGAGGIGINPTSQTLFEGNVKVSPDAATNSLVVTASPGDFTTLQRVVAKLDVPRDQVYVEATIMEIEMERQFDFSSNIINPTSGLSSTPSEDLFKFIADPTKVTGGVFGFKSGQTFDIPVGTNKVTVNSVQGLIKLIQSNTRANILATPQIIALDNTEASFESGESVPVPANTIGQGGTVSAGVTKEKVALSMTVKPLINKMTNMIKLDITTKLSDISAKAPPKALADISFGTIDRSAKTSVIVGDQDTVVIGGLMRDKKQDTESKIPILGDIPVLGWLFKASSTKSVKANLLIFLTPNVVRQYDRMRAILDKKLKERDDFIEREASGVDPNKAARDSMIRSLPNIEDIKKRPENVSSISDEDIAATAIEEKPQSPEPQATTGPLAPAEPGISLPEPPAPDSGG